MNGQLVLDRTAFGGGQGQWRTGSTVGDPGDGGRQPDGDRPLIDQAVQALRRGDLVLLPTETVYGLAADAANGEAVSKIFEAKGRPRFNPLIAHVADAGGGRSVWAGARPTAPSPGARLLARDR
jgi:hypothetical protein